MTAAIRAGGFAGIMADDQKFDGVFRALTGNDPFPWQRAMYGRFLEGRLPRSCRIPTGLGKTSVMAVWLIARAERPETVPRRMIYVVNRRTVVDQSTDEAEKIRANIEKDERLKSQLGSLAISTLRGQFEDNGEWSADPSRPAIIAGTVDMIGSRLLFSGYGLGFRRRPMHAGLLGQDSLLVHDEAHLEPAFQTLLEAIVEEQQRSGERRPMQVMALSATTRESVDEPFVLSAEDQAHPVVKRRYEAAKRIVLEPIADEKKIAERIAELALHHRNAGRAVLVFARSVEHVEEVARRLEKEKAGEVRKLTGTMRGKERDSLVDDPVFRRFRPNASADGPTVYLVCTSAGEVGVNISADHLVCDLSTFESMAQRFGRVNRFGLRDDTQIHIIYPEKFDDDPYEQARARTLDLLRDLDGDGSPASLDRPEISASRRDSAFSPIPTILPVSDILFDAWALTSITGELPGRPPVGPYLRGIDERQPPETRVAWREEVEVLRDDDLWNRYPPKELLSDFPLRPHELLRDRSGRIFDRLAKLAKARPAAPAWLVDEDGTVTRFTLADLADRDEKQRLEGATILLPPSVGGLSGGLFTGDPGDPADDVSCEAVGQPRIRRRTDERSPAVPDDMRLVRLIDTRPEEDPNEEKPETEEDQGSEGRYWFWYVEQKSAEGDFSRIARRAVAWQNHTDDVVARLREILDRLHLDDREKHALLVAAGGHDLGKKRVAWQRSIGNPRPTEWLAKSGLMTSGAMMKPVDSIPYRHEFGSLVDIHENAEFRGLDEAFRDLVLHAIAAHHGFGRPHFPAALAFDPTGDRRDADAMAVEVPRRFARLQRRYGRWGLVYLESLLRAADYAASADPSRTVEVEP